MFGSEFPFRETSGDSECRIIFCITVTTVFYKAKSIAKSASLTWLNSEFRIPNYELYKFIASSVLPFTISSTEATALSVPSFIFSSSSFVKWDSTQSARL